MMAREEILKSVRSARQLAVEINPWRFSSSQENLANRFTEALVAAKGEVLRADSLEHAYRLLEKTLLELDAKLVVFNEEAPIKAAALGEKIPGCRWVISVQEPEQLRQICLEADVGLTTAQFALAETGSIGIASGGKHARLVSLLPPVHVVLLSISLLVGDLLTWEHIRPKQMPSQVVLISGPSKTADIEQTLVVGAHGPKRLIVIIYGGA